MFDLRKRKVRSVGSKRDIRATCQGFFLAVMSLGMASGNFLGGRVIAALDVRSVYGVAVIPAVIALVLYFVNHLYSGKRTSNTKI